MWNRERTSGCQHPRTRCDGVATRPDVCTRTPPAARSAAPRPKARSAGGAANSVRSGDPEHNVHSPRRVEVRLCGKLGVSIDGQPVDVRRTARQGRLVLAYLALHRGEPVTREQLMERLWDDPDPERVRSTLTQTVSRLRGALGADVLERLPNGTQRLQREVGVDVEDAEDELREALDA